MSTSTKGVARPATGSVDARPRPGSSPRPSGPPRTPDLASLEAGQPLRARRSPRWVVAGILAMCLGGLGAVLLWNGAVDSQQVLRVNAPVARGDVVQTTDLGPVTVGVLAGVSVVPASELRSLVGQRALVDLPEGSLLSPGTVGVAELGEGRVRMGLALPAGRVPSVLASGEEVWLIPVAAGDEAAEALPEPVVTAVVEATPTVSPDGTGTLLDVSLAAEEAAVVARLVAADRLVLARVG